METALQMQRLTFNHDPIATEASILNVAGVVQVGLFNNMCDAVVLASENGVQTLMNPTGRRRA